MAAPAEVSIGNLSGKFVMNHKLSDPISPLLTLQGISWFLRKAIGVATVTLSVRQYTTVSSSNNPQASSQPTSTNLDEQAAVKPATETPEEGANPNNDDHKVTHIDIKQVATGGLSTTHENRTLDWQEREHKVPIFGTCLGRSRFFFSSSDRASLPTSDSDDDHQRKDGFQMVGGGGDAIDAKFLQAQVLQDGVTGSSWCKDEEEDGSGTGIGTDSRGKHVHTWVRNIDLGASGGWTAEATWGFELLPVPGSRDGEVKRYHTRRVVLRRDGKDQEESKVERARFVYDYVGKVAGEERKVEDEELDVEY